MDAGLLGGLIGIGAMVCIVCTGVVYEKGGAYMAKLRERYHAYKCQQQPLLSVTKDNPILVRLPFKQFQMKELVQIKQ